MSKTRNRLARYFDELRRPKVIRTAVLYLAAGMVVIEATGILGPRLGLVAREVAHQWWGHQVTPAEVQGQPQLSESRAWYSAIVVVEATHGHAYLWRFLGVLRYVYSMPRSGTALSRYLEQ